MLATLFKNKKDADRALFDNSPELIVYIDNRANIIDVNDRVKDWLKRNPKDLIGKNVFDLPVITPESKKVMKEKFAERRKTGKVPPYDIQFVTADGIIETGRVTGSPLLDKNGKPSGFLIMVANVTALEKVLKQKLLEARESQVRYKALYRNIRSNVVVCGADVSGKVFTVKDTNKYFNRSEEFDKADIVDKSITKVFPGVDKTQILNILRETWVEGNPHNFSFTTKIDDQEKIKEGVVYKLPTEELILVYDDVTREKNLKKELEKNEKKYRDLFDKANDAIFILEKGTFIDCNLKTIPMFGLDKKSDIVGHSPWEFSPKRQPDGKLSKVKAMRVIKKALEGRGQRFYWQHTKKDGTPFDAEVSLNKIESDDAIYLLGIVRDISKTRSIESRLEQSEQLYTSLFENSNDAIFVAEADSRKIIDVNKEALRLTGYKKSELLELKADDLHPKEVREETMKAFKKQARGERLIIETEALTKKGDTVPVSVSTATADVGEEDYLIGSFRDISTRKASQLALKQSEERFRIIVENAQAIIFMIDRDGKFVLSEGEQLGLLGLEAGEVVGKSAFKIYKDYPKIIEGIEKAMAGKFNRQVIKVSELYFDIFFSPYAPHEGEAEYVIGMAVDVTESEKFKQKLKELDKSKTEFVSIASHQLRSPLGAVRWGLEALILSDEVKDNEPVTKSLDVIHKGVLRVINLVNDLLNVSRIEQGTIKDRLSKTDVIGIVEKILTELDNMQKNRNLKVVFNKPKGELKATIYPELFREVVQNMVNNAYRYNNDDGLVIIDLSSEKDSFSIEIANTGYTIPKDEHDQVFKKFYRSRNVSNEVSGTGLGLFVIDSYVREWGGKVTFESPTKFGDNSISGTKHTGTKFKIDLPKTFKKTKSVQEDDDNGSKK